MRRVSGLSKSEREMIVVATSAENQCLYCVVAHGAILRIYEKSSVISEEIAINYRKANISERHKVMLDFAVKTCNSSYAITNDDFVTLHEHGFSDDDIWDIGAITAFFALSNRMANLASMQPNAEFYALGRDFLFPVARNTMTKLHSDQRINWLNQTDGFSTVNGLKIVEWTDGNASLSVDLVPEPSKSAWARAWRTLFGNA